MVIKKVSYWKHLCKNTKIAMQCLNLSWLHMVHGLIPIKRTGASITKARWKEIISCHDNKERHLDEKGKKASAEREIS